MKAGGAGAEFDAIVVGAGHNGLVAGAYLARAGLRTLILERREHVGGALATEELEPGVRVPAVAHNAGRLRSRVIKDLGLRPRGLSLLQPEVAVFAPRPDGGALTLWADPRRTAEELRAWSPADAAAYPRFDRRIRAVASFLAYVNVTTPPDLGGPGLADALAGLRVVRAFRRLRPTAAREVLRVMPMAVADLVGEAFGADGLRGAIASRGIQYTAMGPWSAGTAYVLINDSAGGGGAAGRTAFVAGGPAALADALADAARAFGAEIRTRAEVAAIQTEGDSATGVALSSGEEVTSPVVVTGMDPKRALAMIDPVVLGPTLSWRGRNIRTPGTVAKVNLALSGLPSWNGAEAERLQGRIVLAPGIDYLERAFDDAKFGRLSEAPYLEATIPSLLDPTLAPEGSHVMSVLVQFAPYHLREGTWDRERDGLGDSVLKALEQVAPGISGMVTSRQVLTPVDLESEYGFTGGHPLHGELALDQFFAWRPLLGHARYRLGIPGLYLCGAGAHPGGGITGGPGANAAREIISDWRRGRAGGGRTT